MIAELDGVLVYTADHGNADVMYTEANGVRSPKTSHTLSPVPFAIYDPNYDGEYHMVAPRRAGPRQRRRDAVQPARLTRPRATTSRASSTSDVQPVIRWQTWMTACSTVLPCGG